MLIDPQGREFRYLRLSITDLCNYKCNYCLPDGYDCSSKPNRLNLSQIESIVSSFARNGIKKVRITGGEPTLHRELTDIIRLLKSIPGIEKVALTTNGHRMSAQLQSWKNAGLDAINLSCDSLDPRMFAAIVGRDALADLLQGLDKAIELGFHDIKVNTILLKQFNASQINDLIAWASNKPITLRFIELMQTLDNKEYFAANHFSSDNVVQRLLNSGWSERIRSLTAGPAREFTHPQYIGSVGVIAPYSKDFCQSCNRLRVSSQGKLHLCLFGEEGYDLRPYISNDDPSLLDNAIAEFLGYKKDSHFLHSGNSGHTSHLAMIGG
ncbi:GTP 3',8-cyclase MoaA [Vibrio viridaestus]|uniref:GTP 3',8-cyclase MoaA n=1 Tax=Vibrio viridaestus TaxID=2487322 RepID=A0A3N9TCT9_9VIBR|nr:GTP 3',8-cyclase MoaA [Vibrio viridaestus]RQW61860.1 GTP 3',8-cyclase MoaA [Vibrio viridaestus]